MPAGNGTAVFPPLSPSPPPAPPSWQERFADIIEAETGVRGIVSQLFSVTTGEEYLLLWISAPACASIRVPLAHYIPDAAGERAVLHMLLHAVRHALAPDDRDESDLARAMSLINAGILTPNEVRSQLLP